MLFEAPPQIKFGITDQPQSTSERKQEGCQASKKGSGYNIWYRPQKPELPLKCKITTIVILAGHFQSDITPLSLLALR